MGQGPFNTCQQCNAVWCCAPYGAPYALMLWTGFPGPRHQAACRTVRRWQYRHSAASNMLCPTAHCVTVRAGTVYNDMWLRVLKGQCGSRARAWVPVCTAVCTRRDSPAATCRVVGCRLTDIAGEYDPTQSNVLCCTFISNELFWLWPCVVTACPVTRL